MGAEASKEGGDGGGGRHTDSDYTDPEDGKPYLRAPPIPSPTLPFYSLNLNINAHYLQVVVSGRVVGKGRETCPYSSPHLARWVYVDCIFNAN
jgi:hypothetical protein